MAKRLRITENYIHRTCEKRCRDDNYRFCGIVKYNKAKSILQVHCMKSGKYFYPEFYGFTKEKNRTGCPCCYGTLKLTQDEMLERILKRCEEMDYTFLYFINFGKAINTKFRLKCNKDGKEWNITYNNFINKKRNCAKCSKSELLDINKIINNTIKICEERNQELVAVSEYNGNKTYLWIKCEYGHIWKIRYSNHQTGRCCSKCPHAKQEQKISEYLKKNNISYIAQKTFDGCVHLSFLRFDFYLPQYNICIEYDGKQHYESIPFFGGDEGFVRRQICDNIKNKYCLDNDITLYRIRYDQNTIDELINILNKETNKGIYNG